ncbi:DNA-formamidopyrimidine glycosylase family protein [Kribbella sp. CA-247076]|uniref:DNA-formamidopyrimidine glycosylase family protein n=1 Tax=Kribbella sp. CA-247076 TaxID=3239941 RepID=UPI003D8F4FB1
MPEGDTVWRACKRLDQALSGQELIRTDFRVPALATTDLSGRTVLEVVPRGKHLLMRMSGGVTVHSHFRMDGSWHLYRPGERWRGGPDHQVRAVLETASWIAVGYRLPVLELVQTDAEESVVGHLGPDLLSPSFDRAQAIANIEAQPEQTISEALLDQRNLAGIGNFYRVEVCFLLGLHPWRPVSSVDVPAAVDLSRRLLKANLRNGTQVSTGINKPGQRTWVFERAGKACRRCGSTILFDTIGTPPRERVTHWCPTCQPALEDAATISS